VNRALVGFEVEVEVVVEVEVAFVVDGRSRVRVRAYLYRAASSRCPSFSPAGMPDCA
jgi:hypothetical protein